MNTSTFVRASAVALSLCLAGGFQAAVANDAAATEQVADAASTVAPQLHQAMRALWHEHIVQTRAYGMAVYAGDAAAAQKATDGAVANAKEIANAVAGFYGEAAGTGMLELLAGHWQGVKDLTDARKAGDEAAADAATKALDTNADAVANFLSGANPNLPYDAVYGLMMAHIGYHAAQIAQIMAGNTAGEAETWANMQHHMDMFSDGLADGIAAQFPDQAQ